MIFQHFMLETHESNAYIVGCKQTLNGLLVDCGAFDRRIIDFVQQQKLRIGSIFITHGHWDHMSGLKDFMQCFPRCRVFGAAAGLPSQQGRKVQHGSSVKIGNMKGKVLWTVGHTADSVSLYFPEEKVVFTGDALFAGSIGGTSTQEDKQELQRNIVNHLLSLPDDTEIFPGHGPATTVGIEKQYNPLIYEE